VLPPMLTRYCGKAAWTEPGRRRFSSVPGVLLQALACGSSKEVTMAIGPVQLIVLGFSQAVTGPIATSQEE